MQMPNEFLDEYLGFELTVERNEQQTGYMKDLPTFQDANNIIVGLHEVAPRLMLRTMNFECWRVDQRDRKVRKFAMGVLKEAHWARVQTPTASLAPLTAPTGVIMTETRTLEPLTAPTGVITTEKRTLDCPILAF